MSDVDRCGYVAVVGRPNVGKSTLLNALVGEKISIVSAKPHTTRHRVLGILNRGEDQAVFVDTPGLVSEGRRVLHRLMAKSIAQSIEDADVVLMVVEAGRFTSEDRRLADMLGDRLDRTVLIVNKIDTVRPKSRLLPMLDKLAASHDFSAFLPVSALKSENLQAVVDVIFGRLPPGPALFPRELSTDRDLKFRVGEVVREKLLALVHQEVPYGLTVEVERLERQPERWLVHALIWLERPGHKPIVIGKGGQVLKKAGQAARRELIGLLGERVHLEMWVKIREHWSDSEAELRRLGFDAS